MSVGHWPECLLPHGSGKTRAFISLRRVCQSSRENGSVDPFPAIRIEKSRRRRWYELHVPSRSRCASADNRCARVASGVHVWHSKGTASHFASPSSSGISIVCRHQWPHALALTENLLHAVKESSLLLDRYDDRFQGRLLRLAGGEFRRYGWQVRLQQIGLIRHQPCLFL
jgi:hypothetical protein